MAGILRLILLAAVVFTVRCEEPSSQPPRFTIGFDPTNYTVSEGGVAMLRIVKVGEGNRPVSVDLSTVNGTAVGEVVYSESIRTTRVSCFASFNTVTGSCSGDLLGTLASPEQCCLPEPMGLGGRAFVAAGTCSNCIVQDYIPITHQRLTFNPGVTEQFVNVHTRSDAEVEGDQQFTAVLSNASEGVTLQNPTAFIHIVDVPLVEICFNPTTYTVSEREGNVTFTIEKQGLSERAISVTFSTVDGNATAPGDYTGSTSHAFSFRPSDTLHHVTVPITNDNTYELDETFSAVLTINSGLGVGVCAQQAIVTIHDDDRLTISFVPPTLTYTVGEGESVVLRIVKNGEADYPVSVDLSMVDGTAVAPHDYPGGVQTVVFAPGETEQLVSVLIATDRVVEGVEEFTALLTNPSPRVNLEGSMATVHITDNGRVRVEFDPSSYTVNEGDGSVTFTIVKRTVTSLDITVLFNTVPGLAEASSDYISKDIEITFAPNETMKMVQVGIVNDMIDEPQEMFVGRLTPVSSVVDIGQAEADVVIVDEDEILIRFERSSYVVDESVGILEVCLVKIGATVQNISVVLAVGEDSLVDARVGKDFSDDTTTAMFAPNQERVCINIAIINDSIALQPDRAFSVTFSVPPGVGTGTVSTSTVTVIDDDEVTVRFTSPIYSVVENAGTAVVCVMRDSEIAQSFSVGVTSLELIPADATGGDDVSAPGVDFEYIDNSLEFTPGGGDTVCTDIPIQDDSTQEGSEDFSVVLETPSNVGRGSPDIATVIVTDDDAVSVEFESGSYVVNENGGTVEVCLVKTGETTQSISVAIAAGESSPVDAEDGEDFNAASTTVTYAPDQDRVCVNIGVIDDSVALEPDRGFSVTFTVPPDVEAGPTSTSTVTVVDDDEVTVRFTSPTYSVVENAGPAVVCVMRDSEIAQSFFIQVRSLEPAPPNATGGDDVSASGVDFEYIDNILEFTPGGGDTVCTDIPIQDDSTQESSEVFSVVLETPSNVGRGTPDLATVTITDDDDLTVEFTTDIYTVTEDSGTVTVCLISSVGISEPLVVMVIASLKTSDDAASANDFGPTTQTIIFPPSSTATEVCTTFIIIDDQVALEGNETFNVDFGFKPGSTAQKGTIAQSTVVIFDNDDDSFCEAEEVDNYPWPDTPVGETAILPCMEGSVEVAIRECDQTGEWMRADLSKCVLELFNELLNNDTITVDSYDDNIRVASLFVENVPAENQTKENWDIVLETMLISADIATDLNATVEEETVVDTIRLLDGLDEWNEEVLGASDETPLIILANEMIITAFAMQENFTNFSFIGDNIAVTAHRVDVELFLKAGEVFSVSSDQGHLNAETEGQEDTELDPQQVAHAYLPPAFFAHLGNHTQAEVIFALYEDAIFFPVKEQPQNPDAGIFVGTPVVSAAVANLELQGLSQSESVTITLRRNDFGNATVTRVQCVSYNFNDLQWTTDGCMTEVNDDIITCTCNHLTNFAALVDICSRTDGNCLSQEEQFSLEIISVVGVVLSLLGITLTIITFVAFKKLRKRKTTKYHLQLCIAIGCMLLVFVVGIDRTEVDEVCVTVSALIHYFTLASVMWMAAEAVLMFQLLVIVFKQITTKYIIGVSLICWLTPIVPVVIPLALNRDFMVTYTDNSETDIDFCFIGEVGVFFGCFLGPIFAIILFNCVIFFIVISVLIRHTMGTMRHMKGELDKKSTIQLLITIISLMLLFGCTWLFGAFTVSDATFTFQILFVVFNSLQGIFLFFFFCVLNKDSRELWMEALKYKSKDLHPSRARSSTGSTGSTRKTNTTSKHLALSTITSKTTEVCSDFEMSTELPKRTASCFEKKEFEAASETVAIPHVEPGDSMIGSPKGEILEASISTFKGGPSLTEEAVTTYGTQIDAESELKKSVIEEACVPMFKEGHIQTHIAHNEKEGSLPFADTNETKDTCMETHGQQMHFAKHLGEEYTSDFDECNGQDISNPYNIPV